MTIWAFQRPKDEPHFEKYVVDSLAKGESRFGWGWVNLLDLQGKPWQEMEEGEKLCWGYSNFLLGVKPGDWIVHVNIPSTGMCTAAQVAREYRFDLNPTIGDFGHCFEIDPTTKIEFNRNDERI